MKITDADVEICFLSFHVLHSCACYHFGTMNVFAENVKLLDFLDPVPAIQTEVNRLRELSVNKVFVLGHGGYELDQKIAKQVTGIDVVVGGHSHTFLYTGGSIV